MSDLRILFLNSVPLSVNIARGAPSSNRIRFTNAEYTDSASFVLINSIHEAYETIMNSTRAPFSILPRAIDADGNTVTTTGGADEDRYPLVPEETMIVAVWQQLLNKAGHYPRSVLWNKVKLLEPLVVLGYDAFNELTQARGLEGFRPR